MNENINLIMYKNIKLFMKNKKIKQKELGEKLEIKQSVLSNKLRRLRNPETTITLKTIAEFAHGLGVEPWELLK
ncbi:helix-turn-helix domain-containing protein [Cetobacterium sp.]|uniref:helix-turn-helix domain-containing protein n=1 Tax=Cetobacterium sp. TaxID=2071632 RepID=UPI003EE50ABF